MKKITVVGAGYVGLANSFLIGLSQDVTLIDIDRSKIELLKAGISPINDQYISKYIDVVNVNYTTDKQQAYQDAEVIFIATDTSYDDELNRFNLTSVKQAISDVSDYALPGAIIVIKSTVPIGFTDELQSLYPQYKFIFSPEFLREGYALYDNLYPDRIVIGGHPELTSEAKIVGEILAQNTKIEDVPIVYTNNREGEVVKLFANTYLAMRVSFVNELDTYCQASNLQTENVLDAIGYDHRIGRDYWNPSFGYGGYCLPKDTKQLNSEYINHDIPQNLVSNIVRSNETRKQFISDRIQMILGYDKAQTIGIYRVVAKKGINNFRSSAVLDIAELLRLAGYPIIIFEPYAKQSINGIEIIESFEQFEAQSAIIIANRIDEKIKNNPKVYTADIYNEY